MNAGRGYFYDNFKGPCDEDAAAESSNPDLPQGCSPGQIPITFGRSAALLYGLVGEGA